MSRLEKEFFIDNLLVRIHFIIVMIRWTGLAPWEFELTFPGSLTSTFPCPGYGTKPDYRPKTQNRTTEALIPRPETFRGLGFGSVWQGVNPSTKPETQNQVACQGALYVFGFQVSQPRVLARDPVAFLLHVLYTCCSPKMLEPRPHTLRLTTN